MSGESMEELLAMFAAEPYTPEQLAADREQLIADFKAKHGLGTWDEIIHAVRTFAIDEDDLVERFIEIRAFEDAAERMKPHAFVQGGWVAVNGLRSPRSDDHLAPSPYCAFCYRLRKDPRHE